MLLQGWNAACSTDQNSLREIQSKLNRSKTPGWTVHVTANNRLYYCNQETRTASWLPPADVWSSDLPYGWEQAVDSEGRLYYINHVSKTTSYEDPRTEWEEELHPQPRTVELFRDAELGFGFVAGSEKPVVVRFVTEGGPSDGKLLPGDQILKINDEEVQGSPRDHVIQLVRNCKDSVRLKVRQPPLDTSGRKSAILSVAKKAKLRSNPSRVRFAEGVVVNGSPFYPVSTPFSGDDACVLPIPNVLKVFLENGQTKSFKYDSNTKVKDVIMSLKHKLCIQMIQHFALVLEQVKSLRRNKLTLLNPEHTIVRIASRPGIHNMRCLFRVAFVPRDACDLAQQDLTAFEYLYLQCCNDVVHERYAPELKYDTALRLAALHIHQHAISNNIPYNKVTVKSIEKEFGLDKFVPVSLMESMKRKELRKLLTHLLKLNQTITGTTHKTLTSLQAKLYYLTIISELPSYGAKCFSTGIRECNVETVILVSPKLGISQIVGTRNSLQPVPIADIAQLEGLRVQMNDQVTCLVTLHLPSVIQKEMNFTMEDREAEEFVLVLQGYYRLLTDRELYVDLEKDIWTQESAPSYHSRHAVSTVPWNYVNESEGEHEKFVDFTATPQFTYQQDNVSTMKSNGNGTLRKPSHIKYSSNDNHRNLYHKMITDQNGYLVNKSNTLSHTSPVDLQSVISMEILESDQPYLDNCNHEVIKRVTELQELVENSEQYLTQHQRESSDSDGSHISSLDSDPSVPPPGQLKHSDSLTLLTQSHANVNERLYEAMKALQLADLESDTDSISTPSNSPSHTNATGDRDSNISFGLHCPDNISMEQQNMQDWWRKIQEEGESSSGTPSAYYFVESDFIDLTLIPPPPPLSDSTEEQYLTEPRAPPPPSFSDDNSFSPSLSEQLRHDELLDTILSRGLNNDKIMNLDLDSFLATMTVPPPTPTELTSKQISSFIIPPPPANQEIPVVRLPNGHSCFNNKQETLLRRNSSSQINEINRARMNGTDLNKSTTKDDFDSSTITRVKNKTAPKLPPRSDSLNSLTKRPLPPTPQPGTMPNIYLAKSKPAIEEILKLIEEHKKIIADCDLAQAHGGGSNINEQKFQEIIQELTSETRTLVGSSKSLIRSYMEVGSTEFLSNLSNCVKLLTTLTELSRKLLTHTASPLQTRNLIMKVLDVLNSFHECLTTTNIETETITKHAENLANVLATLLRSLRIFSP